MNKKMKLTGKTVNTVASYFKVAILWTLATYLITAFFIAKEARHEEVFFADIYDWSPLLYKIHLFMQYFGGFCLAFLGIIKLNQKKWTLVITSPPMFLLGVIAMTSAMKGNYSFFEENFWSNGLFHDGLTSGILLMVAYALYWLSVKIIQRRQSAIDSSEMRNMSNF